VAVGDTASTAVDGRPRSQKQLGRLSLTLSVFQYPYRSAPAREWQAEHHFQRCFHDRLAL